MIEENRHEADRRFSGRRKAIEFIHRLHLDALVVIGDNGSQTGAHELSKMDVPVIGIASTIDNDLYGADITIGMVPMGFFWAKKVEGLSPRTSMRWSPSIRDLSWTSLI